MKLRKRSEPVKFVTNIDAVGKHSFAHPVVLAETATSAKKMFLVGSLRLCLETRHARFRKSRNGRLALKFRPGVEIDMHPDNYGAKIQFHMPEPFASK